VRGELLILGIKVAPLSAATLLVAPSVTTARMGVSAAAAPMASSPHRHADRADPAAVDIRSGLQERHRRCDAAVAVPAEVHHPIAAASVPTHVERRSDRVEPGLYNSTTAAGLVDGMYQPDSRSPSEVANSSSG
jgi:hypothetical protein